MTTILLIEDDPTIRLTVEFTLTKHNYAVSSCADGQEGLETALMIEPDLILLDVMLPNLDGFDVVRKLRKEQISAPVLILTALSDDEDKIIGLDAGADDYITKPFSTEVLLARIRAHLRRSGLEASIPPTKITYGDLTLDYKNGEAFINNKPLHLRAKELELLLALAERKGMLCKRAWLTERVWKEDYLSTSRTIDVHIRRLRAELDRYSNYSYIHTVHGMGYRFEPIKKADLHETPC